MSEGNASESVAMAGQVSMVESLTIVAAVVIASTCKNIAATA